ncbi:hypothetical protein D0T84_02450 [Dysgonomonas sp. 521]|uniref:hypothetical protein n=1 Tax=Dysgonomonas sp. 521 TaxID=2302932 RepID=UPI0013D6D3FA|nr:hypothetical protein [Dysgonomonas sp. 521]NDV93777.1 hypothetical protein [Dysgonomonas sp. 521]
MNKLREFCFYAPLVVLIFSILFSLILFIPITMLAEYFPRWLRPNMGGWTFVVILVTNTVLSFLSLTVALNVFRFVRSNRLSSFLSFFWAVVAGYAMVLMNPKHPDFGFNLLIPLGFLIPQIYSYYIFRKRLDSGYFDVGEIE